MKSFFSDLGIFNYSLLLVLLSMCIISVDIITYSSPTITPGDIQEQYIMDLDEAVKAKYEELKRKGLLVYRGGDMRWEKY